MSPDKAKQKRIVFNWQDIIAIVLVVIITAGVFIWTLMSSKQNASSNSFLVIKYGNKIVTSKAVIKDKDGKDYTYTISLRRQLSSANNESYTDTSSDEKVNYDGEQFAALSSFSSLQNKYLIVSPSQSQYSGFSDFIGPQVDIKVFNGGFQITKEDSPNHVCSNQGFVTRENLPVVCLPNSLYCSIMVGDGSSYDGPDA